MIIEFNENLLTGNETIDNQHRELIDRIASFVRACESGDGKIKAIQMLDYLAEYTDFHFAAEEELQLESGYPGYEVHKEKHEEFKKTVSDLHAFLEESEGPTAEFVEKVKEHVVEWLFRHIEAFDRSVATYVSYTLNPGNYS